MATRSYNSGYWQPAIDTTTLFEVVYNTNNLSCLLSIIFFLHQSIQWHCGAFLPRYLINSQDTFRTNTLYVNK